MIEPGLLSHLDDLGVKLSVSGNKLRYKAPKGVMTDALRTEIIKNKAEILASLSQERESIEVREGESLAHPEQSSPSYAQERLWFLDQLAPANPFYNISAAIALSGPLNLNALQLALDQIATRHCVLRSCFVFSDSRLQLRILPAMKFDLSLLNLSDVARSEQLFDLHKLLDNLAHVPFTLSSAPLVRAHLVRLNPSHHVLLITMHHIISDAWSMGVFFSELASFYNSFCVGKDNALPTLAADYSDFVRSQRLASSNHCFDSQLQFWKDHLGSDTTVLDLPTDYARPPAPSFKGCRRCLLLPEGLSRSIKDFSQAHRATLFMSLFSAFNVLLARYCRQNNITVATAVSNRSRSEFEPLIGLFVNTIMLKTDLTGNPTFSQLLDQVKHVAFSAYANQDVPFDMVVAHLNPQREVSRNPLSEVMFVMQNSPLPDIQLHDLEVSRVEIEPKVSRFDLLMQVEQTGGQIEVKVEYNTDLFEAATINRLLGHYKRVLELMVACPDSRILDFALPTEAEQEQMLVEWNNFHKRPCKSLPVHQLFEAQVKKTPDQTALVCEGEKLSYAELNNRANKLAHHLRSLGVGPDTVVGICVARSFEMIVAVLGVLKAGGTYLPLDPAYPKERLAFMIEDANMSVLVTGQDVAERLPLDDVRLVFMDTDWATIARLDPNDMKTEADPDNLAYVIYTSGSTGRPKGIGLSHRALYNLIEWHLSTLLCGASVLQFASLGFDASFHEIFAALASGGTLFLIAEDARRDVTELARFLSGNRIEKVILPVVVLQQLAEEYCYRKWDFTSLKEIISTGEQLQITRPIRSFFNDLTGCSLHNHYGPSETHVVTAFTLEGDPESWDGHPSIGRPISNTEIYLLDEQMNPVPVGVPGKLYIGGVSLARGYTNRSDLTAERFIPSPFSREPGERLYDTGDLARYKQDGKIEFLGRVDHQIKIRGFRVEPGEIEALLGQHPAVKEGVVVVNEDIPGNKRLVAYVVSDREGRLTQNDLRIYLKQMLPDYLIPSAFVIMEALPMTANGKVDRAALTIPREAIEEVASQVPPRTPAEELVARIWSLILGVEQVGVYSNFFDLGGHSLLATQIILRLREIFRKDLPLRALFEMPTVNGVVDVLSQMWGGREIVEEIAWTYLQVERLPESQVESILASRSAVEAERG